SAASGSPADAAAAVASDDRSPAVVADDAELDDIDQMLREIEADLSTADREATTPEEDPTK
ncbi:MAG: hypothetical protein QOF21_1247, partial [Actinomycetota bacterium]